MKVIFVFSNARNKQKNCWKLYDIRDRRLPKTNQIFIATLSRFSPRRHGLNPRIIHVGFLAGVEAI
jgi:hypothetical protein